MEIQEDQIDGVLVLGIKGRLDSNTSKAFEDKVNDFLSKSVSRVIIDFHGVDYINSTGLRVLLYALQQMQKSGHSLVLCSIKDYMREVFDISGYSEIFTIEDDRDGALRVLA